MHEIKGKSTALYFIPIMKSVLAYSAAGIQLIMHLTSAVAVSSVTSISAAQKYFHWKSSLIKLEIILFVVGEFGQYNRRRLYVLRVIVGNSYSWDIVWKCTPLSLWLY